MLFVQILRTCIGLQFHLANVTNFVCNPNVGSALFFMLNVVLNYLACLRSLSCRARHSDIAFTLGVNFLDFVCFPFLKHPVSGCLVYGSARPSLL